MEKAKQTSLTMRMIDGEIDGHGYGNSSDLGVLICRAAYDLIDKDPDMLKPLSKGMRKVIRMKIADRVAKWIFEHVGYAFIAVFMLVLLGCCIVV